LFDVPRSKRLLTHGLVRSFGRPAKRTLIAAATFTLIAGGSALAAESTPSPTPTNQAATAQSLLPADTSGVTEVGTPGSVTVGESDSAGDAVEASKAADAADIPKPDDASKPDGAVETDDAQGVHGACVSAVAQDKSTVGREHGQAVSEAAHSCAKGSDDATDVEKPDVEKPDVEKPGAADTDEVEKTDAVEVRVAEKSDSGETHRSQKSEGGKPQSHHKG
jgi:hypothetical protein